MYYSKEIATDIVFGVSLIKKEILNFLFLDK